MDKLCLLINGELVECFDYFFVSCCNLVQGDVIFVYLMVNVGLKIYCLNCLNVINLIVYYGYWVMKAEWVFIINFIFVVNLKIMGIDDGLGVIEWFIYSVFINLGFNICFFSIEGNEGYFIGQISLLVKNIDQLYMVIQGFKNLDNIFIVIRVD